MGGGIGFGRRRSALAALLGVWIAVSPAWGLADDRLAKAAMVLNIVLFVDWPEGEDRRKGCRLCVLQASAALPALATIDGRMTPRGAMRIVPVDRPNQSAGCDIFYADRDDAAGPQGRGPILIIGDREGLWSAGGVVEFVERDGHLRFRINHDEARARGLMVSSKLIGLAESVR
ncbi:MAG: YfiR family protein [Maricaulaceae bacterium]